MTTEEMAEEVINRLTPIVKTYSVRVERILTDEFEYEIEASNELEARSIAANWAHDEGNYDSEEEISVWSVKCNVEEEVIQNDPNQMSLLNIQGGHKDV